MLFEHSQRVEVRSHGNADGLCFQSHAQRVIILMHVITLYDQRRTVVIIQLRRQGTAEKTARVFEIAYISA